MSNTMNRTDPGFTSSGRDGSPWGMLFALWMSGLIFASLIIAFSSGQAHPARNQQSSNEPSSAELLERIERLESSQQGGLTLSLVTVLIALAAFGINTYRAYIMGKQLDDSKTRQQYYQTVTWLMSGFKDVDIILNIDPNIAYETWTQKQQKAARELCYRYHILGVMLRQKMFKDEELCLTWYYSIQKCYPILNKYIDHTREKRHKLYYTGVDYLVERTAVLASQFKGFQSEDFNRNEVLKQIETNLTPRPPDQVPTNTANQSQ